MQEQEYERIAARGRRARQVLIERDDRVFLDPPRTVVGDLNKLLSAVEELVRQGVQHDGVSEYVRDHVVPLHEQAVKLRAETAELRDTHAPWLPPVPPYDRADPLWTADALREWLLNAKRTTTTTSTDADDDDEVRRDASWLHKATDGGIYASLLKGAREDGRLTRSRKIGSRWHYALSQVYRTWPGYKKHVLSALSDEGAETVANGRKR